MICRVPQSLRFSGGRVKRMRGGSGRALRFLLSWSHHTTVTLVFTEKDFPLPLTPYIEKHFYGHGRWFAISSSGWQQQRHSV
jgi:hypothetical protein